MKKLQETSFAIVKTSRWIVVFVSICSLTACSGGLKVINEIPPGKGYVDFFFVESVLGMEVYQISNENWVQREINPLHRGVGEQRYVIGFLVSPGDYHFAVKVHEASMSVRVRVFEGMITPVWVKIRHLKSWQDGSVFHSTYEILPLSVGKPVPANADSSSFQFLMDLLDDSNWAMRVLALEALATLRNAMPETLKELLEDLSEYDSNQYVRRQAKFVLEKNRKNR